LLEENGWSFSRHGKKHDVYRNGSKQETIPRHNEIPEPLVKAILSRNGISQFKSDNPKEMK